MTGKAELQPKESYGLSNVDTGKVLRVYQSPWRKRPALAIQDGGVIYTLAYFRDEESLQRFEDFLRDLDPGG